MSTDTIFNSENKIKDIIIDKEIYDIFEHCKTKDLNKADKAGSGKTLRDRGC